MNEFVLDFERPLIELEKKIQDMKDFSSGEDIELSQEIKRLEKRLWSFTATGAMPMTGPSSPDWPS